MKLCSCAVESLCKRKMSRALLYLDDAVVVAGVHEGGRVGALPEGVRLGGFVVYVIKNSYKTRIWIRIRIRIRIKSIRVWILIKKKRK